MVYKLKLPGPEGGTEEIFLLQAASGGQLQQLPDRELCGGAYNNLYTAGPACQQRYRVVCLEIRGETQQMKFKLYIPTVSFFQ